MEIILGIGSNVGDRGDMVLAALAALAPFLKGMRLSAVYESRALLPDGAPAEWDMPFLNMAVAGQTELSPVDLLSKTRQIEAALGRRDRGRWGPREIDIDILACGDTIMNEPGLAIPHPEMLKRDFVLVPVADVAPGWIYPVAGPDQGKTIETLLKERGWGTSEMLKLVSRRP
jgi:2-amino-4-hydroxy-6-hydroxymethyldihydropteridine diphosphokinase